jgi:DNA-3-methyladenine glycosylase I
MPRNEAGFDTPTIPEVVEHPALRDVFEVMTRAVFQTGVSWAQIAKHWNAYGVAFDDFDPLRVAAYCEADIERVLTVPGILRMPRKVRATVKNAAALCALAGDYGDFHAYAASFATYAALAKDLKKRFAFLGDMNAWYLLFRVNVPVPRFERWVETIPGDHPRMREMVELARASGRSRETD